VDRRAEAIARVNATSRPLELVATLLDAADDTTATRDVAALIRGDDAQAKAVLDLQFRRFARLERTHLNDQLEQLDEAMTAGETPDGAQRAAAPDSRLTTIAMHQGTPTSPPATGPRSEEDRESRRLCAADQRAEVLAALRTAVGSAAEVMRLVTAADDAKAAGEALAIEFGWSAIQAVAVLDMGLRQLPRAAREQLAAAR
jgi:DNA gyrase/topoisomerase IV subunit A